MFPESLLESTNIDPTKAVGDVELEEGAANRRKRFGENTGRRIEIYVREAIPDYVLLKSKRLRI